MKSKIDDPMTGESLPVNQKSSAFRGEPRTVNDKNHRRALKPLARCYLVCSPEYGEVVPVLDYGEGPMEYGCDVVYAFARNARRAKIIGVRWFRRRGAHYLRHAENPFSGVTAERLEFCPHCNHAPWRESPCDCCEACEGTGDGAIHGVEGMCSACNGSGRAPELVVDPSWSIPNPPAND